MKGSCQSLLLMSTCSSNLYDNDFFNENSDLPRCNYTRVDNYIITHLVPWTKVIVGLRTILNSVFAFLQLLTVYTILLTLLYYCDMSAQLDSARFLHLSLFLPFCKRLTASKDILLDTSLTLGSRQFFLLLFRK
jgi:hypothetical protein